jgi:hypothetical protein
MTGSFSKMAAVMICGARIPFQSEFTPADEI